MRAVLLALSFGDSYESNKNILEEIRRNFLIFSDPYIITDRNIGVYLMSEVKEENIYIIPLEQCRTLLSTIRAGLKKVKMLKRADLYLITALPVAHRSRQILRHLAPWLKVYSRFVKAGYNRHDQRWRARHLVWSYFIEPLLFFIPWPLYKRLE